MNTAATDPIPALHPDRAAFDAEVEAYVIALRNRRRSPATIRTYRASLAVWARWMTDQGRSLDPLAATRRDAQAYAAHLADTYAPSAAKTHLVTIGTFFRWEVGEALAIGDVIRSPFEGMKAPALPQVRVTSLTDRDVDRLLAAAAGRDFESLRDRAVLALMVSTGLRRQEVADLLLEDVDVASGVVRVAVGKGERERIAAFGGVAQEALRHYVRARARHRDAAVVVVVGSRADHRREGRPLFLVSTGTGHRGGLGASGITKLLERRAQAAGLGHVHPHQLRHTYAHTMLSLGVPEGAVMQMGGWRTRSMLDRYGADLAQERAVLAYRDPLARDRRGR